MLGDASDRRTCAFGESVGVPSCSCVCSFLLCHVIALWHNPTHHIHTHTHTNVTGMSEVLLAQLEAGKAPKPAKLLSSLRELSPQLDTEGTSFTPAFAAALAGLLPQLRDTDNDSRKLARLVHFYITEIVGRHAGAKNVAARLLEAVLDDLHAATYFPRQLIAIQSIGILSTHYYAQYGLSVVLPQEKVYRATLDLVRKSNVDLQRLPFALLEGGGGDASSKQRKELMESLALSGALAFMIRQVLAATRSESGAPEWMAYLYTVCFATESFEVNADGARAGHAALLELASKAESTRTEIAVHLYSNKKLLYALIEGSAGSGGEGGRAGRMSGWMMEVCVRFSSGHCVIPFRMCYVWTFAFEF